MTTTTTPTPESKSCIVVLLAKSPGNTKGIDAASAGDYGEADASMLHMSKELLRSPELSRVKQLDGRMRAWLRDHTIPTMLRPGMHLLPVALIGKVRERIAEYGTERDALIEDFITTYPTRIDEARESLQQLFDPADYPAVEAIRKFFKVRVRYLPASFVGAAAGELASISEDIYREEQKKAEADRQVVIDNARALLRNRLKEVIGEFVQRLAPQVNGKKKIFRDSLVPNFLDALDLLEHREITNDDEMCKLVAASKAMVSGLGDTGTACSQFLRDWQPAREELASGFTKISKALDAMLVDQPERFIDLEDD